MRLTAPVRKVRMETKKLANSNNPMVEQLRDFKEDLEDQVDDAKGDACFRGPSCFVVM